MKSPIRSAAVASAVTAVIVIVAAAVLHIRIPLADDKKTIPTGKHCLQWDASLNRTQTLNSCGPYCTRIFLYEKTGAIIDPELINREMPFKTVNRTYPWGITRYLRRSGIQAHVYWFAFSGRDYYIRWIKNRLDKGEPVIVTVNRNSHYMTIVGYEADTAFVYDPAWFGNNGELPGNREISFGDPAHSATPLKIAVACAVPRGRGTSPSGEGKGKKRLNRDLQD